MKPAKRNTEYEKLDTDNFLTGTIEDIKHEESHLFKGFTKKKTGEKVADRTAPAVQFKFRVDGYTSPHHSRWMTFNYGERSTLYSKYLVSLVEGAEPDMDFDLEQLKGMKVKMLWTEKNDFQSLETIRPAEKKAVPLNVVPSSELAEAPEEEEPPF